MNSFSVAPNSTLLSPSTNSKILKFVDVGSVGTNTLKATDAFKRIQQFSKINNSSLFVTNSDFTTRYSKIKTLYLNDNSFSGSFTYGTTPQHNFTAPMATQANSNTYLEAGSIQTY